MINLWGQVQLRSLRHINVPVYCQNFSLQGTLSLTEVPLDAIMMKHCRMRLANLIASDMIKSPFGTIYSLDVLIIRYQISALVRI